MSITPSSQDPLVHHEPPASSELPHKRRRVFDTIEDFIKLLRAVPTHSSSPIQAGNSANRDPGVLDAFGLKETPVTPLPYIVDEPAEGREDIDLEWVKWAALNSVDATEPLPGSNAPIVTTITLTSATPRRAERQQVTDLIRSALADVSINRAHNEAHIKLSGPPQLDRSWTGSGPVRTGIGPGPVLDWDRTAVLCRTARTGPSVRSSATGCGPVRSWSSVLPRRGQKTGPDRTLQHYLQGCYEWDLENLSRLRGRPQASAEWHDAKSRRDARREDVTPSGAQFSSGTISEFFSASQDASKCINLLDIPLFQGERPWIIDEISDDVRADWHGPAGLSSDHGRFSNWALATTGCFLTHIHHDANGAATWVSVSSGAKIWTLLTPRTQNDGNLIKHLQRVAILPTETHPGAFQSDFHFSALVLRPGSLLIQPPGQLHMVYTPMKTIAVGGHFLTYDTLPHSLLTRRLERLTNHLGTNASHPAVDRLLSRMALALPTMPTEKLGKWQFLALFELILLAPLLYPTGPEAQLAGKKRKHDEEPDETIPFRKRMTEDQREHLAALQILRILGEAVGCPITSLSLCPLRWRSPQQPELLEIPALPSRPTVMPADVSELDKLLVKNRNELWQWVKQVKVELKNT
ncbi:hypothetical protein C8Q76DRAFT_698513 [Earliella scabrosa]|nr:hypothetical protein C8Q76DRAFT_698513 [Earliella scabrosa]